jgi:hypothetical protein
MVFISPWSACPTKTLISDIKFSSLHVAQLLSHNLNLHSKTTNPQGLLSTISSNMEVHFTFAETPLFQCTKKLDQAIDHTQQPHLPIPSLPCPAKPLSISSYPIELTAEPQTYSPKHVASLWLQLISIHIQCGNFWGYKDVLNTHRKVVEARSRADQDNGQPKPLKPLSSKSSEQAYVLSCSQPC